MSAAVQGKQITWSLTRDAEGHRTYKITHLVKAATLDGPQVVMVAAGLPTTGSIWSFDNDSDPWAFCLPTLNVAIYSEKKGSPNKFWTVENTFSTKPKERCQDESIEDPLLEPMEIGCSFVKNTQEITKQRANHSDPALSGQPIKSSSHEMIRGPQVEFDFNRAVVQIGQNVAILGLEEFTEMIDTLNDDTLWGLATRKVKLSNVTWSRKVYGVCNFYYTRNFDFDIDFKTFDRTVRDEGTKALNGHWPSGDCDDGGWILDNVCGVAPDKDNPQHFNRYKDRNGENARVILDGDGEPATSFEIDGTGEGVAAEIEVEHYEESNFLLLGIPTSL